MKKKNGSIMITTLICFSILSVLCIGCIELINCNNKIIDTSYKSTIIKYKNRGGLEMVYSKVLEEVNKAIEKSLADDNPNEYFKNYFLVDNKNYFIIDIENINMDNIDINIINDKLYFKDNNIKFEVTCNSKLDNIKNTSKCSFTICTDFDFNNIKLSEIVQKHNY